MRNLVTDLASLIQREKKIDSFQHHHKILSVEMLLLNNSFLAYMVARQFSKLHFPYDFSAISPVLLFKIYTEKQIISVNYHRAVDTA